MAEFKQRYGLKFQQGCFLQFASEWCDEKGWQQVLGVAEPTLLYPLKYKQLRIHVDAQSTVKMIN
eukprot:scaffold64961_cov46-Cyclotella_meneghiniana.AAC.3